MQRSEDRTPVIGWIRAVLEEGCPQVSKTFESVVTQLPVLVSVPVCPVGLW